MRVRVRFAKTGKVRWTSHRDVARMFERAFRRTQLPLAYSEGFSPRPKVSFGLALPTGAESVAEYLDLEIAPDAVVDVIELQARLTEALPVGMEVTAAAVIDDRADSLQQEVTSCTWVVELPDLDAAHVAGLAAEVLSTTALPVSRERKGKWATDDLRRAIVSLEAEGSALVFELTTQPRGVRPTEVLAAVRPDLELGTVRRTHQWIERDGARFEPLGAEPATTDAPHAERRAS